MNINFQGIVGKVPQLTNVIQSTKPDVIIGTETWIDSSVKTVELFPPQYTVYRKDRNRNGGGVLIAISNSLSSNEVPELSIDGCELIWAKIKMKGRKHLLVGSYYRPHTKDEASLDKFATACQRAIATHNMTIIGGDLNFPAFDWNNKTLKTRKNHPGLHYKFLDLIHELGLTQMVTSPTRKDNTLDLYLTNYPSLVPRVETAPGLSDHDTVYLEFDLNPTRQRPVKRDIKLYNKANWTELKNTASVLSNEITSKYSINSDTESIWKDLKDGLHNMENDHVPSKTIGTSKTHVPWMDTTTLRLIRKRDRTYKWLLKAGKDKERGNARMTRQSESEHENESMRENKKEKMIEQKRKELSELKRQVQRRLRQAYWAYTDKLLDNDTNGTPKKPKKLWTYIKSKRTEPANVSPLKVDGKLEQDPKRRAEILNAQFKSAFSPSIACDAEDFEKKTGLSASPPTHSPILDTVPINEKGVYSLLKNLDPSKSPGPDKIRPRLLKELALELAPAFTLLYQSSLTTGIVPTDWKHANVAPIFKKGERYLPGNYRPISLTSIPCKILEHILVSSILKYCEENNILCPEQHGFRRHHSCETQLIGLVDEVSSDLANGNEVDALILDFAKAFDKVSHALLVHKIAHLGIVGEINRWIEHFLQNRTQVVVLEGATSESAPVESGVPQGSVLGPTLFLLYINDLPKNLTATARLFADDTLCHRPVTSDKDEESLQQDIDRLAEWEEKWQMKFHPEKCQCLRFTRKRKNKRNLRTYRLHNHPISNVQEATYLGVTLKHDLSWDEHINKIVTKANKSLGFLRRNLKVKSKKIRETAYLSIVRPCLEYACSVWDPSTEKLVKKLEAVQRRAARWVSNRYRQTSSVGDMLSNLKWKSLKDRRSQANINNFFKYINDKLVINSKNKPLRPSTPPRHSTRTNHPLFFCVTPGTPSYRQDTFFPRTIKQWNLLPTQAVLSQSLEEFQSLY